MADWLRHIQRPKTAASIMRLNVAEDSPPAGSGPFGLARPCSRTKLTSGEYDNSASTGSGIAAPGDSDGNCLGLSSPLLSITKRDDWSLPKNVSELWHRPTPEQVSEALFVAMVNKPPHESLPVEYDAYVQRLVEGYASLSRAMRTTEQALAEEKETKERSMVEFARISRDWEQREAAYKAEIRRMELLLANSAPNGVGAVLTARSGSIIDRSIAEARRFKARVKRASGIATAVSLPLDQSQKYEDLKSHQGGNLTDSVFSPRYDAIPVAAQERKQPRTMAKSHRRTFSFNPGEDELNLSAGHTGR